MRCVYFVALIVFFVGGKSVSAQLMPFFPAPSVEFTRDDDSIVRAVTEVESNVFMQPRVSDTTTGNTLAISNTIAPTDTGTGFASVTQKTFPAAGASSFAPCLSGATQVNILSSGTRGASVFALGNTFDPVTPGHVFTISPGFATPSLTNRFATMEVVMHVQVIDPARIPQNLVGTTWGGRGECAVGASRLVVRNLGGGLYFTSGNLADTSEANPNGPARSVGIASDGGTNVLCYTTERVMLAGPISRVGAVVAHSSNMRSRFQNIPGSAATSFSTFFFARDHFDNDINPLPAAVNGFVGFGAGSGGDSDGDGDTIGFGTLDEMPIQAISALNEISTRHLGDDIQTAPRVQVLDADGVVVAESDTPSLTTTDSNGVVESVFDISDSGPFDPGYYTVRVDGNLGNSRQFYVAETGDVDLDGQVDNQDVDIVLESFLAADGGEVIALWTDGDINGDGLVTSVDVDLIQNLVQPEVLLGDVNLDDVVNFADIPAFISLIQSGEYLEEADINEDGRVDFADIPAFIDLLLSL